jgi:hypothetical protein
MRQTSLLLVGLLAACSTDPAPGTDASTVDTPALSADVVVVLDAFDAHTAPTDVPVATDVPVVIDAPDGARRARGDRRSRGARRARRCPW